MTTTTALAPRNLTPDVPLERLPAAGRLHLRLMAGGLTAALAAAAILAVASGRPTEVGSAPLPAAATGPTPMVLNGPGDVSVVTVVYEAGQTSGWHAHAGLHAVAVVSGELAVYGPDCTRQAVVPGQPYVGGRELHLARNESDRPVDMIVTYLNPAGPTPDRGHVAAPQGCPVA